MKPRATSTSFGTIGFMAGAVLFAAIAGVFMARMLGSSYSRDPVRALVVAKRAVAAGQPLRAEDLGTALWPITSIPEGAFGTVEEVMRASRVPLIPMVRGEPVLQSHLSQANAGIGIAPLIDKNHRAMSIRADDPVTLARLIYPGARVDLISTIRSNGPNGQPITTSQTVIQNAKVLAVGEDIDPLSSTRREKNRNKGGGTLGGSPAAESDGREARGVVTLLVTLEEAETLSLASREGKLDVVLRGPKDGETVSTSGVTAARLVGGGKVPTVEESDGLKVSQSEKPALKRRVTRSRSGLAKAPGAAESSGGVIIFRGRAH